MSRTIPPRAQSHHPVAVLAEDDALRTVIKRVLEDSGFRVSEAENGEPGLRVDRQGEVTMRPMNRLRLEEQFSRLRCVLEQSERILAAIPSILIGVDGEATIVRWNAAAEETFGIPSDEALGRPFRESGIRWEDPHVAERIMQSARGSKPVRMDELAFRSVDGGERFLGPTVCPLDGTECPSGGFVLLAADITERKLLQWQFQQAQKLEAVGELAGGVAHEFNNLLQAISGYTTYAMEELSPNEQPYQDLQEVQKATERAAVLTRELLGFSRKQKLQMSRIGIAQVMENFEKLLKPVIGEQVELDIRCAEDTGSVLGDAGMLQQMLLNLCINARDAMPSGGKLTVTAETVHLSGTNGVAHKEVTPGRYAVIEVTDTGTGIPPDAQEHIFEPFYTTKEVGKGTGLGLAMVYGTVQQHGGTIVVNSEPGRGTTFRIYLPTIEGALPELPAPAEETRKALPRGAETVLVAEDEPMIRDLTVRVLQEAGYKTVAASNGEEAVHVFEKNADVVSFALLDMMMPKLSGAKVYRRIKALKPDLKVIFFTGYDPQGEDAKCLHEDGLRLIQKPLDHKALLDAIREIVEADGSAVAPSSH